MSQLGDLKRQRLFLLEEIVEIDAEIRKLSGRELVQQNFTCSCNSTFKTYLERQLHIMKLDNANHYPLGQNKQYFICGKCKGKYISQDDLNKHNCKPVKISTPARLGRDLIDFNKLS